MRVKVFECRTSDEMQRHLDEWIDRNKRCEVISLTACDSHSDGTCQRLLYVVYREWARDRGGARADQEEDGGVRPMKDCPRCKGTGEIMTYKYWEICSLCGGSKQVIDVL